MKKSVLSLAIVLVLSASTSTMFAAVSGTNPRPQAVSGTNPRPQVVDDSTDTPSMMQMVMAYFGM